MLLNLLKNQVDMADLMRKILRMKRTKVNMGGCLQEGTYE